MIPSFVLYADVLGFSAMTKQALNSGEGNKLLNKIHNAFTQAYNKVRKYSENRFDENKSYEIKILTDNIVIGIPAKNYSEDFGEGDFGFISMVFSEYQAYLAANGFFIRGGIAFGDHYMDDDIVFGNALIEAVKMDKSGGPPRISFAPSAVDIIKKQLFAYGGNIKNAPHYISLLKDSDGTVFLNYLEDAFYEFPENNINFALLEQHKIAITEGLSVNKDNPDMKAKYDWIARYHNFICREYYNNYNNIPLDKEYSYETLAAIEEACQLANYLIDIESFSVTPRRIENI